MLQFVLAGFAIPFLVSVITVPIIRALAPGLGLIDEPGHRKVHVQPTPRSGGISIWLGIATASVIFLLIDLLNWTPATSYFEIMGDSVEGNPFRLRQLTAIATGASVLFFLGLADDRWSLPWWLRLGFQLLVSLSVVLAGVRATVFVSYPWFGIAVSILWILVLTNAMNFLDNMDALSAGIGVIASLIFVVILLLLVKTPAWTVALTLLMLAGSLSGFLVWNRPPATVFMGDCGSNLTGFLLATTTIMGTFYDSGSSRHVILAPLCVLAIPLYDFCTVILIRLRQGRSPFHGDKSHFSHRLVELGLKPAPAVLTIHLATLMTGLGGILLYKVSDWTGAIVILVLIACVLAIVGILETVGRHSVQQMQLHHRRSEDRHASSESAVGETEVTLTGAASGS